MLFTQKGQAEGGEESKGEAENWKTEFKGRLMGILKTKVGCDITLTGKKASCKFICTV